MDEVTATGWGACTKFERARLVGERAIQIEAGEALWIDPCGERDPVCIALRELTSNAVPWRIARRAADGTVVGHLRNADA